MFNFCNTVTVYVPMSALVALFTFSCVLELTSVIAVVAGDTVIKLLLSTIKQYNGSAMLLIVN
jgi:hypothetical protein